MSAAESRKDRRGRRVRVDCRLFLFGDDDFELEARVIDLSAGGCSASCSEPVKSGMQFRLSLFLADQRWPVRIDGAVVRWVSGDQFGLEFFQLQPSIQERIRRYVREHPQHEV